ncbi:SusD/RagB family nutrient-binding outer membrane lipoprotein [Balneolales bacterium ANBcel1]|nr:SusD/RagB family nutrient-binding outer membrane lipoprotein [Balneolales bacterium ANBcel1]
MKLFKVYLLTGLLLLSMAACDGFLDVNEDPNRATEVPGDLLLPTVLVNVASNRAMEIQPGTAFFINAWASNGSTGVFIDPDRYIISSFSTGNTWVNFYATGLKNLDLMRADADAVGRVNVVAQADILKSYLFWMLTAMWEDIPYTQALDGDTYPHPEFDDQETILRGIVETLENAVAMIDPDGLPGVDDGDLIFGGDMEQWEKFANSLKLRTLMMIRNQDAGVDSQIAALLNEPLIRTNADEAAIPFFDETNNENLVWRLNNMFGGFTNSMNGNSFIYAGETLVDLMKDLGDPRIDTYFELAVEDHNQSPDGGGAATTEHFGQTAGVANWNNSETSMVSQNIIRRDWPSRILPAAEVWFYEAEFLALTGDLNGAHASYLQGVQAALDFFDGKPGAIAADDKQAYIDGLPGSFGSQGVALNAIHAQQYIEVLDRAPENWTHWRRTKYPDLPVAEQAVLGDIIRRFPLPPSELSSNPNTPAPPNLDAPMWFEGN